jgi:hypothetical protein
LPCFPTHWLIRPASLHSVAVVVVVVVASCCPTISLAIIIAAAAAVVAVWVTTVTTTTTITTGCSSSSSSGCPWNEVLVVLVVFGTIFFLDGFHKSDRRIGISRRLSMHFLGWRPCIGSCTIPKVVTVTGSSSSSSSITVILGRLEYTLGRTGMQGGCR